MKKSVFCIAAPLSSASSLQKYCGNKKKSIRETLVASNQVNKFYMIRKTDEMKDIFFKHIVVYWCLNKCTFLIAFILTYLSQAV